MSQAEILRSSIIEKILKINDLKYLTVLENILSQPAFHKIDSLNSAQEVMLKMSLDDMANGRLISEQELDGKLKKWLGEK